MNTKFSLLPVVFACSLMSMAGSAFAAGNNNSPPAGAILDLGGGETGTPALAINHGAPVTQSVSFIAGLSSSAITFAFREDPAFIFFSNARLIDNTTNSSNLLVNGNFATGLTGWNYANIYGATYPGTVTTSCGTTGWANCWYDGSVQAYDAISQTVATNIGDSYTLSFDYTDNSSNAFFSDLSTNGNTTNTGGNGIDILAYVQAGLPQACQPGVVCTVPEPGNISLIALALVGLGAARRQRKNT